MVLLGWVEAYMAITIAGGRAPFSIIEKDRMSSSRREHSDDGCSVLLR